MKNHLNIFVTIITVAIILVILFVGYKVAREMFFENPNMVSSNNSISGTIGINGIIPQGATVTIQQREMGSEQFQPVVENISPTDNAPWNWNQAQKNMTYQLQAVLVQNGKNLAASEVITVTAPATNEILNINSQSSSTNQQAAISGVLNINGPVPSGSTVSIGAKQPNQSQYTMVATNLAAEDNSDWSWTDAQAGALYQLRAYIIKGNSTIAESSVLQVAAPASNEQLTINIPSSQSNSSSQNTSISGTINLNGTPPSGSTISIAQRVTGQTQFNTVVTGLNAANNTPWSWAGAKSGTSYDIQAYLVVNNNTVNTSQTVTLTAPASNEVLNLNYTPQLAAPTTSVGVQCVNSQGGLWSATLSYNVIPGAQQYWLQLGASSSNPTSILNNRYPLSGANVSSNTITYTTGYVLQPNTMYYVNYAYSPSSTSGVESDFSGFSNVTQFQCQQ